MFVDVADEHDPSTGGPCFHSGVSPEATSGPPPYYIETYAMLIQKERLSSSDNVSFHPQYLRRPNFSGVLIVPILQLNPVVDAINTVLNVGSADASGVTLNPRYMEWHSGSDDLLKHVFHDLAQTAFFRLLHCLFFPEYIV